MLDKKTELMLAIASTLTAEDLDELRATAPAEAFEDESPPETMEPAPTVASEPDEDVESADDVALRGARERARTRESKVSTACVGQPREPHTWWPVGTELVGHIGSEEFTAVVVANPRVKSDRSVQITSGSGSGRICLTPTRAAIEATEAYRQSKKLGRGGGITNAWVFWKTRA